VKGSSFSADRRGLVDRSADTFGRIQGMTKSGPAGRISG
jgi:hypothetical protein